MTKDEALKLALDALLLNNVEWKSLADSGDAGYWRAEDQAHYKQTSGVIDAIKEALAQPEQGPVAWGIVASNTGRICQVTLDADEVAGHKPEYIKPLYTSPPQRQPAQDIDYWYFRYHETLNKLNSVLAQPEQNLTCKSTQARLAACWRYVKAQPEQEQEPECPECKAVMLYECVACSNNNYPPRREWVGLTQDEQQQAYEQWQNEGWGVFYNAMEAKLKEKNT
jgi:hypothetical protein